MCIGTRVVGPLSVLVFAAGCPQLENEGFDGDADTTYDEDSEEHPEDREASSGGEPFEDDALPAAAPSTPAAVYDCNFTETFDGPTGAPWPEPWIAMGGIAAADLRSGWGRLRPTTSDYSLARMLLPLECQDVDATVTFLLTDTVTQLAVMYGRHNGGFLQETVPRGRGYAVTAENFRTVDGLSLWRELGGTEQDINPTAPVAYEAFVPYRMRLWVKQQTPDVTLVRGKVWLASEPEPDAWTVEVHDNASGLRKRSGSVALDAFSSVMPGDNAFDVYFDDLVVTQALPLPEPELPVSG